MYSAGGIGTPGNSGDGQRGGAGDGGGGNGAHGRVVIIPNMPPSITSALTASGTVGQAITTYTIAAANNPTGFSASGLPAGLAVNTSTGAITGTPTTAGTFNSTIGASNSVGSDSKTLVWTIVSPVPVINSTLTKSGTVGQALSYSITATNNPTSYSASNLPPGLSVSTSTGAITGTPTAGGSFNSTIGASNGAGSDTKTLVWTISVPKPVITSSLSATALLGQFVSYGIAATNNPTSYGASNVPPGLSLNSTTGTISGTPSAVGIFAMQITAANSGGTSDPVTVQWTVSAPTVVVTPANTGTAVINGNVGVGSSSPQARLHVVGHVNNEVARFQGRTDASNFRNFMSLYSTNPDHWWEFSVQDPAGNGTQNGFALRAKLPGVAESKPRFYLSPPDVLTGRSFMRLYSQNVDYGWEFSIEDPSGGPAHNGLALREIHPSGSAAPRLYINSANGEVGIGTTQTAGHMLAVNGKIRAKEVVVDTGWADYVFADDYDLAPLAEVETHIKAHRHLPGIPSAAEVEQGGVSLGEMQARLLAKIEELTLHQIAQEKRLNEQSERLHGQLERIQNLESENAALRTK